MALAPISHAVTIDLPPALAFARFADQLGQWWPLAYSFSGPDFAHAAIDPHAGGRWFERTKGGEQLSWGKVHAYDRGKRLVLGFAIGADRRPTPDGAASEVEVRFEPDGDGTSLTVEHRAFERHGDAAEKMREGMASPQGWPLILAEFARECRRER
jgi:uncharacterized protein YndB with AHSA1/START domain